MNSMSDEPQQDQAAYQRIDSYVFRAIANYTYDWESWHAPDGKLLWVNAAVERMTGYRPDECLQMLDYPLALVVAGDRARIAGILRDAKDGGSGNDVEFQLVHRDGSMRWAAVSWQPMYDDMQKPLGFRASVRDITERHQLREELRLHNQHLEQLVQERTVKIAQLEEHRLKMEKLAALGQMAAGVAHEVNNPLAGIRNAFALFKGNLSSDDENYELIELIDSSRLSNSIFAGPLRTLSFCCNQWLRKRKCRFFLRVTDVWLTKNLVLRKSCCEKASCDRFC